MKTRHFMMIAGLLFAGIATANEKIPAHLPIEDKDVFEKQYIGCIESGFKNKCFSTLLGRHLMRSDNVTDVIQALQKMDDGFPSDFARVYKVHPLDKIIKGKALDIRTYLIEHDNGGISGTYISLVNIKEKWYVSAFFFRRCRHKIFAHNAMHRICTAATKEAVFLA